MLKKTLTITAVMALGVVPLCPGPAGRTLAQEQMPQSFGEALARALLGGQPQQPQTVRPAAPVAPQAAPAEVSNESGNLSDAFYRNQAAGVSRYASWQAAHVQFSDVAFIDGQYRVSWQELPSTYQAENADRQARMDQKFSWQDWNAVSSSPPSANRWTLTCLFSPEAGTALSTIRRGAVQTVRVKIKSAVDRQLVFDCRL
jgi:hypothetical protein